MRTTVNIEEHLLAEAKVLAARQHRTLGEVIDDSLRVALSGSVDQLERSPVVLSVSGDPKSTPLVDLDDKEALAEAIGDNARPRADR